jgi:hypothetical protein
MYNEGPSATGQCWPQCSLFKCGNRSLRNDGGVIQCIWINDTCIGPSCSYAVCIRGKMLGIKRCGLTVRRVTAESHHPDRLKLNDKIKVKLSNRIKDLDDLY